MGLKRCAALRLRPSSSLNREDHEETKGHKGFGLWSAFVLLVSLFLCGEKTSISLEIGSN